MQCFLEILRCDMGGQFDSFDRAKNLGFAKRQTLCAASTIIHTIAPLHCDIFQQNKLFPPLTTISIVLHPSPDNFRIRIDVALATRNQKMVLSKVLELALK